MDPCIVRRSFCWVLKFPIRKSIMVIIYMGEIDRDGVFSSAWPVIDAVCPRICHVQKDSDWGEGVFLEGRRRPECVELEAGCMMM